MEAVGAVALRGRDEQLALLALQPLEGRARLGGVSEPELVRETLAFDGALAGVVVLFEEQLHVGRTQLDAEALDDPCPAAGYEQYLSLYSPRFHRESGPVVARLGECQPTQLREEIAEAAVLGIPGLFWVFVSAQLLEYGRQTGRM